MMGSDINQYTRKQLKIKHQKEKRKRLIRGFLYLCLTSALAVVVGLFCQQLLLMQPSAEKVMKEHQVSGESWAAEPETYTEPEPEPESTDSPRLTTEELNELMLVYSTFNHGRGWNLPHRGNSFCMSSMGEYVTAMKLRVENQMEGMTGTIEYSVKIRDGEWQDWVSNGGVAGLTDTDQPMEAFRARFTGEMGEYYDLYYSVLQDGIWNDWVKNGADAGITGNGMQVEGIRLTTLKMDESGTIYPGKVDPDRPMIALTFDDGPTRSVTPRILETLAQNGARATFFMVGSRVPAHSDIVEQMLLQGSEVGNHTMDHIAMERVTASEYAAQLIATNQVVVDACGVTPVLMRPCEGFISPEGMEITSSIGMSAILWTVDTRDWSTRNADMTVQSVLDSVKDGDIVLMHDLYSTTADAVEIIVPELISRGYQLVTVSELAAYRGGILPGQKYGAFRKTK